MKKHQTGLSVALKQEFREDLELFKHFLLLINNAGPIRNVELMWNEELDPMKPKFKNRVGTEDALVQLQPVGSTAANRKSPSTIFCDLVHGFGAYEEQTCAKSDVPAQQRCQATGCAQVYACHLGLTDIAVPVTCDGQYLGTLFSGQVLTRPPTKASFQLVRRALAGQSHIDLEKLEAAYFRVPVVDPPEVAEMVRMLELFARYIANSWKRLQIMAELQRTHDHQLAMDRKELAAILLSGELGDQRELKDLAHRSGLQRLPDRVMVLQIKEPTVGHLQKQIASALTLNRLSHMVEDFCQTLGNTLTIVVRPGELCIFTSREVRNNGHEHISLQGMAEAVLEVVHSHSGSTGRIGISASHCQPSELVQAFQEACAAMDSNQGPISFFSDPVPGGTRPMAALERLVQAVRRGADISAAVRDFLVHAMPGNHSPTRLQESRAFLTWGIEHLALEITSVGAERQRVDDAKEQAISGVLHAPSPFRACESLRRFAEVLVCLVAATFSKREQKIVLAVSRVVDEKGPARVTIQDIASALHLSSGHLSRVFRRTTGMTLETFIIRQRVELAKRTLLDPRLNVAEVAERCGFCNPAYFASVFRKYVNCTPREFARGPQPWVPLASSALLPAQVRLWGTVGA